ncbi:MAG: hypothetical protein PHW27_12855 [Melioribacteraceae bacterium]|nr:hypothetical protein [Melioribacteraceae bacterium]MDD3559449.1 hypothetical protein [Melioribacteraceae bacterium]
MSFGINIFFLFLIINISLSAQITPEQFNLQRDSLIAVRASLTAEKAVIKSEIDSLKEHIIFLEREIEETKLKLYIKKYGQENGMRVASGQIWKGMSEKMMRDSWGEPDKIDKNVEKWGVFTQWYYGNIIYFFRDGILTDWEEK